VSAPAVPEQYQVTEAEVLEKQKLQKHFGKFDILFFLVCTIVGLDTIGSVANKGPQAFVWLIVLAGVFFFPYALLTTELGVALPEEGGQYVWVRLAFGRLAASVNNFLYWITNPVWLGGTLAITGAATIGTFFLHSTTISNTFWFYVFGIAFIWVGMASAILSFKVGKWIPTVGAWSRFIVLGLFVLTTVIYAIQHGLHGVSLIHGVGASAGGWKTGFILLLPILMFNYVGFELPNAAGDEMKNPGKDVPFGIARAGVLGVLLYALPILGILLVLPAKAITNLSGFLSAIQQVFTVYGGTVHADGTATLSGFGTVLGDIIAVIFVLCLLSSGVTWIMGSDRSMAVSGYDGAAPRSLGVINARYGTPVRVNVMSGIVATIILVGARQLTSGNASKDFAAVLSLTISTTLISYLGIFPALAVLRRKMPDLKRPYRAPAATFISVWLTVLILFATVELFLPGLGAGWFSASFAPSGWAGDKWGYLWLEAGTVAVFILIGVAFYLSGSRTREHLVTVTEGQATSVRVMSESE